MGQDARMSTIRCLVSAGPTREFFDPVRYLSNPSSGKMGYAIADAAARLGWEVDLVSGPVSLQPPAGVRLHKVVTGAEMLESVSRLFPACDILIMTAAIMDYRPKAYSEAKIKKTGAGLVVEMEPVADILKTVAAGKTRQLVVGFAAETNDVEAYGRGKLVEKNCDYVVANRVGQAGSGFEADENSVSLLCRGIPEPLRMGPAPKAEIASRLVAYFSGVLESRARR